MGLLLLKKGSIFTLLILAQKLLFAGDWEGTYAYQEKVESKVYQYEIIIYELESKTIAEFKSKSSEESYIYDCKITSLSDTRIDILVNKCISGKGLLKKDDILLGLEQKNGGVFTHFGAFSPKQQVESGKMYFKFNKDRIEYMKKYANQMPYEVGFFRNNWVIENMKAALKEKYDGLMAFLQVNDAISFKDNILYLEASSADKKGMGNSGKNIIVIDITNKNLFVCIIDGNEKLSTYSSGKSSKPKVLSNWINKYN